MKKVLTALGVFLFVATAGLSLMQCSAEGGEEECTSNAECVEKHGKGWYCDSGTQRCKDGGCTRDCAGKECGDDGCGGICGECTGGMVCQDGLCACETHADTGCHQDDVWWFDSCGSPEEVIVDCPDGCEEGICKNCEPQCGDRECGPDPVCGSSCGTCPGDQTCNAAGQCEICTPDCAGRECGGDSCGGSCGTCPQGESCVEATGQCVSTGDPCVGVSCGEFGHCVDSGGNAVCVCENGYHEENLACVPNNPDDPCDGVDCSGHGTCIAMLVIVKCNCDPGYVAEGLACIECIPDCEGKECGDNGCGGSCGTCPQEEHCNLSTGLCESCEPDCDGRECGPDPVCGSSCGTCPQGEICEGTTGQCCLPDCSGRDCGDDGCGGSCGTCPQGDSCNPTTGLCESCTSDCAGRECGDDGCGGSCGTCDSGITCNSAGRCEDDDVPVLTSGHTDYYNFGSGEVRYFKYFMPDIDSCQQGSQVSNTSQSTEPRTVHLLIKQGGKPTLTNFESTWGLPPQSGCFSADSPVEFFFKYNTGSQAEFVEVLGYMEASWYYIMLYNAGDESVSNQRLVFNLMGV